ncbi:ABD1 [Symbiodinium sp. KB8]|nr:ABD1 [Symbiodinium sp. KB8]
MLRVLSPIMVAPSLAMYESPLRYYLIVEASELLASMCQQCCFNCGSDADADIRDLEVGDLSDMESVPVGFLEHLRDERDICPSTGSLGRFTDERRTRPSLSPEEFESKPEAFSTSAGAASMSQGWNGSAGEALGHVDPGQIVFATHRTEEVNTLERFVLAQDGVDFFESNQQSLGSDLLNLRRFPGSRRAPLSTDERLKAAEAAHDIEPGEVLVRAEAGANNWPQREKVAQALELHELANSRATARVVLLLGEDSFMKSLKQASGKHRNSGIFQLQTKPRRLIVFPRGEDESTILQMVPEKLRSWVQVAPYRDLVEGLSSSKIRSILKSGGKAPPSTVHPVVWNRLLQAENNWDSQEDLADDFSDEQEPVEEAGRVFQDPRTHYDALAPQSMQQRLLSPTVRLRNFNSFAKAGLLEQFLSKVLREVRGEDPQISVLDLGCGKGGDVKKLVNSGVTVYCGVDVSFSSLEVLVRRVQELQQKLAAAKHGSLGRVRGCPLVEVSLVHADCWQQRLEPAWDCSARHGTARLDAMGKTWFHLVTSQMACHYAFRSQASVDVMLQNASSRLCRGGYFVGTVPNSSRIISLERNRGVGNDPRSIGNRLFRIDFGKEEWKKVEAAPDLWQQDGASEVDSRAFGVMYTFHLADAVEAWLARVGREQAEACPEPLVHFPSFIALAKSHGLHLCLGPTPLTDFVDTDNMKAELGRLRRIYAFEGGMALDTDEASEQREASGLYVAFAFRKEADSGFPGCQEISDGLQSLRGPSAKLPQIPGDIVSCTEPDQRSLPGHCDSKKPHGERMWAGSCPAQHCNCQGSSLSVRWPEQCGAAYQNISTFFILKCNDL